MKPLIGWLTNTFYNECIFKVCDIEYGYNVRSHASILLKVNKAKSIKDTKIYGSDYENQASMERLRVLYKGRERIPNIREALFTQREKRSIPLIASSSKRIITKVVNFILVDLNVMLIISSHSPSWEYKTRSRYIVKPNLVHEVDIHNIFSVGKS